jgi:hypothetical protein
LKEIIGIEKAVGVNESRVGAVEHFDPAADVPAAAGQIDSAFDVEIELIEGDAVVLEIEHAAEVEVSGRIVKVPCV